MLQQEKFLQGQTWRAHTKKPCLHLVLAFGNDQLWTPSENQSHEAWLKADLSLHCTPHNNHVECSTNGTLLPSATELALMQNWNGGEGEKSNRERAGWLQCLNFHYTGPWENFKQTYCNENEY